MRLYISTIIPRFYKEESSTLELILLNFPTFTKYLKKVFESPLKLCMTISGLQNMVKFTQLISKEASNKKCYAKYAQWKLSKILKPWQSPFPQTFFTRRALEGHMYTWKAHRKALGQLRLSYIRRTIWNLRHLISSNISKLYLDFYITNKYRK